jgi:hyperosmotically inducible periplasmic protein
MLMKNRQLIFGIVLAIFLLGFAGISAASNNSGVDPAQSSQAPSNLAGQIRHELLMLPDNGVFDDISFSLEDSHTIILSGQVVRPILKSEAEAAVSRIQGVTKVINKIEVLPVSPFDDVLRLRTYRAIFSRPGFEKYANQAISPLRIIVKNGNITLAGVVGNELDKTMAEMAARLVPGAFSVSDELSVD